MALGLTATGPRNILPGYEFDKFFTLGNAIYSDPIISRDGTVEEAVKVMTRVAEKYKSDTALLAPVLAGQTIEETCRNIWNFIYTYIQYREDAQGIEQIRRPLRSWVDRSDGVDCDCMSVFASSILKNLGIKHYFRITKYGKPEFQHVYVVVPAPEGMAGAKGYYTIDGVIDGNNKEKTFTDHKDFNMQGIPIHVLNGFSGTATEDEQLYAYLVQTRDSIEANPSLVQDKICPCDAVPLLTMVINEWPDLHNRAVAIEKAAKIEANNFPDLKFFQLLWKYMEGQALPGEVKMASYIGLGDLPEGAIGPELPEGYGSGTTSGSSSSSGNWWTNWGSGVSNFLEDILKTGAAYSIAQTAANHGNTIAVTPATTTPANTVTPVTPGANVNQAGMGTTGTVLLTIGIVAAIGALIYAASSKPSSKKQ